MDLYCLSFTFPVTIFLLLIRVSHGLGRRGVETPGFALRAAPRQAVMTGFAIADETSEVELVQYIRKAGRAYRGQAGCSCRRGGCQVNNAG